MAIEKPEIVENLDLRGRASGDSTAAIELPVIVTRCPEWRQRQAAHRPTPRSSSDVSLSALFAPGGPRVVYKAVATELRHGRPERFFSIYAGKRVEYRLGEACSGLTGGPDARAGVFCYDTVAGAQCAPVPAGSAMQRAQRAVLACRPASSDGVKLGGGKMWWGALVPLRRLDVVAEHTPAFRL